MTPLNLPALRRAPALGEQAALTGVNVIRATDVATCRDEPKAASEVLLPALTGLRRAVLSPVTAVGAGDRTHLPRRDGANRMCDTDQMTADDVTRLFKERKYTQIEDARAAGRLNDLLAGGTNQEDDKS